MTSENGAAGRSWLGWFTIALAFVPPVCVCIAWIPSLPRFDPLTGAATPFWVLYYLLVTSVLGLGTYAALRGKTWQVIPMNVIGLIFASVGIVVIVLGFFTGGFAGFGIPPDNLHQDFFEYQAIWLLYAVLTAALNAILFPILNRRRRQMSSSE